jgi:hypothetical protein
MKYRMLRKKEKPDKAKGDQRKRAGRKYKTWHLTLLDGNTTVKDLRRMGCKFLYRRPIQPKRKQAKERRPLSVKTIRRIVDRIPGGHIALRSTLGWLTFARTIEYAHGIK